MAATVSTNFSYNHFQSLAEYGLPSAESKSSDRYNSANTSHRDSKTQYRNYLVLNTELYGISLNSRRGMVKAIVTRLNDPSKTSNESHTRVLTYKLRLQALVWAFFDGRTIPREFLDVAYRDLSADPGYAEVHTTSESSILFGYYTAISNFRKGATSAGLDAFDAADKRFGELRHAEWLAKNS